MHAALLVDAEDRPHGVFALDAQLLERSQTVQADQRRALVVRDAASVHIAVADGKLKGERVPVVALGNDVKMRQHAAQLAAFSQLDMTRKVADLLRLQTELLSLSDHPVHRFLTRVRTGNGFDRDQLCQIALPSVGVITNVGMVHASRAGSMEVIAKGKSELVQALPADGTAILNYDDPYVRPMAELTDAKVFYYGLDPAADLFADKVESFGPGGLKFDLNCHGERKTVRTPLIGRHSVLTALRGAAVGLVKGMEWDEIITVLENSHSKLRMRLTHTVGGGTLIDDSYNASPDATIAALTLLGEMAGRRIAVLGEMRELGQYEKKGHEMVGEKAAVSCDELVAVGPVTKYTADAAAAAGMKPENIHWFATVPEAIEFLQDGYGTENDVLLVKGSLAMGMSRIVSVIEERK